MRRTTRCAATRIRAVSETYTRHRAKDLDATECIQRLANLSKNSPAAAAFLASSRHLTKPRVHRRQVHRARHCRTRRFIRSWFQRLARRSDVLRSHAVSSRCRHFFS